MKKTNLYFNHAVVVVTIHNKREEMLVRIIKSRINSVKEYYIKNKFGEKTFDICWRITEEVNTLFSSLFFLNCIKTPFAVSMDDIV